MSGLKLVIKLPKPSGSGQAAGRPADRESDPGQQQREPKRRRSQPEGAPKAKKPRREAGGEAAPTLEAPRPGPASDPARPGPQPERGAQGGAGEAPKPRLVIKFKAPQQPAAATGAPPAQQSAAPGGSQAPGEPRKKKKKKRPRPPEGQQPPQGQGQAAPAPAPAPRSEDGGAQQPAPPPRLPPKMRAAVPASAAAPAAARPPSAASAVGPAAAAAASAPSSSGRPVKTEQPPPAKVSALPKKLPAKLPAAKAEPPQAASGLSSAVASAAAGAPGRPPGLARPAPTGAAPPAPDAPSAPDIPPAPGMVDRLLVKMERKDPHGFFKDPVTDEVAPGYSEVIRRPMSFSQMRARLAAGEYATWPPVQEDLETMFNNAMVFNAPASPYHKQAREMMRAARAWLQLLRTTGALPVRGRKPGSKLTHPPLPPGHLPAGERRPERRAAVAAAARVERVIKPKADKKRVAARKAAQRAAASGVLARPGAADDGRDDLPELSLEEDARCAFAPLAGGAAERQFRGLARGHTAGGVAFAGRPALRPNFAGALTLEAYSRSLGAFGRRLGGRARGWLERALAAAAQPPQPKPAAAWHGPGVVPGAQPLAWAQQRPASGGVAASSVGPAGSLSGLSAASWARPQAPGQPQRPPTQMQQLPRQQ